MAGAGITTYLYQPGAMLTEENLNGSRTTFAYDNENRLLRQVNPDQTRSTYSYDGDGLRRYATEPGAVPTQFIWDGTDYLMEKS